MVSDGENSKLQISFNLANPHRVSTSFSSDIIQKDNSFKVLGSNNTISIQPSLDTDLIGINNNFATGFADHGVKQNPSDEESKEKQKTGDSLKIVSHCRKSKINDFSRLNPWEKIVVTQEGIDNWRAQLYGTDLNNFPKNKPA